MPFDIVSVDFQNDTVTVYPKFCNHIKTIPICNLLEKQGHRYCGLCFEKFGIDTYNNIVECVIEKGCSLVTSKEHFMNLNMGTHNKITIIGKCTHEYETKYWDFKNGQGLCQPCLHKSISDKRKEFYTENRDYAGMVEVKGNDVFRKYISDDFDIVCVLNCIADMLIKPKCVTEDLWLPIQIKATIECSNFRYKFVIKNNDYTNTVLVCICVSEETFWVFEGSDIPKTDAINIYKKSESSKSIHNKFLVSKNDLSSHMKNLYSESKIKNTKEILSIPICDKHKLEYKYKLIREGKFENMLIFEYPEIDSTVYDFICNGLKVQEKIGWQENNVPYAYRVNIRKTKDRNSKQPYNEKDNDVYWFNLMDTSIFYVVPNEIMNKLKYLSNHIEKGKTALLLYPEYKTNPKGKRILSLELNNYKFDYENIDLDRIKKIFNIQ